MTAASAVDYEALARELEQAPAYRVLRRFKPEPPYFRADEFDAADLRTAIVVDTETTGLDPETDEIIELAMIPFTFHPASGRVVDVLPGYHGYEEPSQPIPPEVTAIHGLTDADVRGQRIDDAAVAALLASAHLLIAHNAGFDRPRVERRLPATRGFAWACSQREVPWEQKFGTIGAKLGNVLEGVRREFYEAHRAEDDCRAVIHTLAHRRPCETCMARGFIVEENGTDTRPCGDCVDGEQSPLIYLLGAARATTTRIYAMGAPFSIKDRLKARHYRWSDGTIGRKAWFLDVASEAARDEELMWLRDIAGVRFPETERITAKDRFSARVP